ncbi:MAG: RpoL/Rpb11 RNA polymerase subunit family protein [Nitrososphaerota archaeon]
MKLDVIKERDDYIEILVKGEDQSVLDAVSEVLQKMQGVEYAGHSLLHPLTGEVRFIVKTRSQEFKARDILLRALEELADMTERLRSQVEQL